MAVYCNNDALGVIITSILICTYSLCFLSNCYLWRLTNQLHQTATQVDEEKERAAGRASSRNSSIASVNLKNHSGSVLLDEEEEY